MTTKIEWCDSVWNPTTGCYKISAGCYNCYAERMAKRLRGRCGYPADDPFRVTLHPERLSIPDKLKKPRRIFLNSMGDLFHDAVPDFYIDSVFEVMNKNPRHTFMVLTKRPGHMLYYATKGHSNFTNGWPLENVFLGVSVENQIVAEWRVPLLLQCPGKKFISAEPLLGPVRLDTIRDDKDYHWNAFDSGINWVIAGAETGPRKRPMDLDWARSLRDQCQAAGVPFFYKKDSDGNRELDGRMWEEFPNIISENNRRHEMLELQTNN